MKRNNLSLKVKGEILYFFIIFLVLFMGSNTKARMTIGNTSNCVNIESFNSPTINLFHSTQRNTDCPENSFKWIHSEGFVLVRAPSNIQINNLGLISYENKDPILKLEDKTANLCQFYNPKKRSYGAYNINQLHRDPSYNKVTIEHCGQVLNSKVFLTINLQPGQSFRGRYILSIHKTTNNEVKVLFGDKQKIDNKASFTESEIIDSIVSEETIDPEQLATEVMNDLQIGQKPNISYNLESLDCSQVVLNVSNIRLNSCKPFRSSNKPNLPPKPAPTPGIK